MARPKKKSVPTLNIITFCDIITVSMVAMFMVLIIVTDQAIRTPTVRPIPLAMGTTNAPIYFECRSNQVFYIDRRELDLIREQRLNALRASSVKQEDLLQTAMKQDIGNRFYRFDNSFLMMGIMALHPREEVAGTPLNGIENPTNDFLRLLSQLKPERDYVVYLVRDDSFPAYRAVRALTFKHGLLSGWEYLSRDEVITFEGMFAKVRAE